MYALGGPRRRDDEEDDGPRRMEDMGPSKADESDDWGKDRKPGGAFGGGGGGGFGDRDRPARTSGFGGDSDAADTAESWGSKRPSASSTAPPRRAGGAFGGFDRDGPSAGGGGVFEPSDRPPRRAGDDMTGPSRADEESRWGSKFTPGEPRRAPSSGADDAPTWGSRRALSPGDAPREAGAPTSRPRLNIKPRTAPVPGAPTSQDGSSLQQGGSQQGGSSIKSGDDSEPDAPAPAASSGPRSNPFGAAKPRDEPVPVVKSEAEGPAASAVPAPAAAPAPRSNPFGAARPREEVLRQQGRSVPEQAAPRYRPPPTAPPPPPPLPVPPSHPFLLLWLFFYSVEWTRSSDQQGVMTLSFSSHLAMLTFAFIYVNKALLALAALAGAPGRLLVASFRCRRHLESACEG